MYRSDREVCSLGHAHDVNRRVECDGCGAVGSDMPFLFMVTKPGATEPECRHACTPTCIVGVFWSIKRELHGETPEELVMHVEQSASLAELVELIRKQTET